MLNPLLVKSEARDRRLEIFCQCRASSSHRTRAPYDSLVSTHIAADPAPAAGRSHGCARRLTCSYEHTRVREAGAIGLRLRSANGLQQCWFSERPLDYIPRRYYAPLPMNLRTTRALVSMGLAGILSRLDT